MSVTVLEAARTPAIGSRVSIHYSPSCQSLLTADVRAALDALILLLIRGAEQQKVPILKIDVRGFSDPEEDNPQVVVRQWVNLPPGEALDYWESLGQEYKSWLHSFPEDLKQIAAEKIAFEIRWVDDNAAF